MEGINSRLDALQAAILSAKLPHLPRWTAARQAVADHYDTLLADVPEVTPPLRRPHAKHVFHLYVIRAQRRDALREALGRAGIPTILSYPKALPYLPAYAYLGHTEADFPMAAQHQHEILSLPIYPELTPGDQVRVAESIQAFYKR